ncbi:selenium metabolism-associated LysR family transcriptional regulator [Alkalibacter mobilis]|uniref:selenium metabolism-associated LysR family transcriptional regulator n=1 Tax=Alkalibacter mobilis TaxID=2787712 RepID=UPI00189DA893|nr:selenium metabolism-associated LysR family transcriptional regulator [Alkalibacter mobilis]MBF7096292.1 LysR family transcriptional regulator [Alkalibacter mobilis]
MDFKYLSCFVMVAQQGSFSKAADLLCLSQPAVSSNIHKLEAELEIILFNRTNKGIKMTPGGILFYRYAMEILNMCERTEQAIKEHKNSIAGFLDLYSSTIPGQYLLPRILKQFAKRYPDVQFSIRHKDSREVVDHVLSGNINIGFVGAKYDCSLLEYIDFYHDRLVMIASPEKKFCQPKLDFNSLKGEAFILREEGSGTRLLVENALKKKGLDWSIFKNKTISDSMETIVKMVELNMGLSFISEVAVDRHVKMGLLQKYDISDLDLTRCFSLVYCKNRCLSPTEERFKEFVSTWNNNHI